MGSYTLPEVGLGHEIITEQVKGNIPLKRSFRDWQAFFFSS
jgi:hypothetical protein